VVQNSTDTGHGVRGGGKRGNVRRGLIGIFERIVAWRRKTNEVCLEREQSESINSISEFGGAGKGEIRRSQTAATGRCFGSGF